MEELTIVDLPESRVTLNSCSTEISMANLTITIEEHILKRARIRALEQGTSVNKLLRQYLEAYAAGDERAEAMTRFVRAARRSRAGSGTKGRTWTREDLHER